MLWRWKRALLAVATRLGTSGTLIVHSTLQAEQVRSRLGSRWQVDVLPYQVDTNFWRSDGPATGAEEPLVLAVGSEYRDYDVLLRAAEGLRARVVIAAGSHWARFQPQHEALPSNVEFVTKTLGFEALRDLYRRAAAVVVPLQPIENQAGITTMLEAMSMERPLVVTATAGQLESVRGPLVDAVGQPNEAATADRGPQRYFGSDAPDEGPTGLYVPVGDATAALRAALSLVVEDHELAQRLGQAARAATERHFTVEQFAERFARSVLGSEAEPAASAP